jgi:VRR-NUC domain
VWFCHVGNGGYRRPVEAAIMSGLGLRRGAPDLIFIVAGRTFGLELKAPGGRLSPAQRQCHEEIRLAGGVVGVAASIDEATNLLSEWGVLR